MSGVCQKTRSLSVAGRGLSAGSGWLAIDASRDANALTRSGHIRTECCSPLLPQSPTSLLRSSSAVAGGATSALDGSFAAARERHGVSRSPARSPRPLARRNLPLHTRRLDSSPAVPPHRQLSPKSSRFYDDMTTDWIPVFFAPSRPFTRPAAAERIARTALPPAFLDSPTLLRSCANTKELFMAWPRIAPCPIGSGSCH
jgi:hypothetical protein